MAALGALPWVAPQLPALIAAAVPASGGVEAHALSPIGSEAPLPPVFRSVPSIAGPGWAAVGAPLKVIIPRLRISSSVVPISGRSGELVPPGDAKLLGWWKEGAPAGSATGSTVITGHTVSAGGGAFDHLGDLRSGDRVRLRTAAGAIDYVVRQARDVPVADLARAAGSIFSQTVPGRLVLVTCSDFNGTVYLSNAVVYADPVLAVLGSDH